MKKMIILFLSLFFIQHTFAAVEDTQVIDELDKTKAETLKFDFKLKKFASCDDMSNVLTEFIKKYYKQRPVYYRGGGVMLMDDLAVESSAEIQKSSVANDTVAGVAPTNGGGGDYSTTNTQVAGVDESEIVKTDGKYIYYAVDSYDYSTSKTNKVVYIVKNENGKMTLVKKVKLPDHFYSVELYVQDGRLIILANGYPVKDFQKQFWTGYDPKTYVMVFDTKDIENLKLLKLYMTEGAYTQTRLIGDNLYVVGSKDFYYYNLYSSVKVDDLKVEPKDVISNELDLTYTDDTTKQDLTLKGKDLPYEVNSGEAVNCSDVEYLLPDDDTIEKYSFNPSFNIVSIINIKDVTKEVKHKVVFGDVQEIHMSQDSLYLTNYLYTNYDFKCGPGFMCPMMWYPRGENTLIHKFDIEDSADLSYKNSTVVSGNPLNQYSMDEYNSNFRIITSSWYPDRATNLFVLDKDLNMTSSLTELAKDENFQSSRFIKDKLFLVTFKQIDPLFVIDLKDIKNPKVLGELKIPGYSTYLHPYDENHLIGLGYDTKTNKWGGTQNAGIKVDLYEVNYDKKCGDTNLTTEEKKGCENGTYTGMLVKQQYSLTLGDVGSYSEALNNPRMFVWNDAKKLLFLPANIYGSYDETTYKYKDFYSGLFVINIDKDKGIKELYRTTHIDNSIFEEARKKECDTYIEKTKTENKCTKLIDGTTYCPQSYVYVPEYCYEGASISDYVAGQSWRYNNYFIKRALYIGDNFYSISDGKIKSTSISTLKDVGVVNLK
ncbi:MAG: beta-propeller domain-containing protein [Candidatus Gracilibacteria bacterium]|nr:beta-propeller domain-containing protein [Candidatus Gracilibacteria bacterium]